MSHGRANGMGIAFRERPWRLSLLVAGAVLIGLASSVPSASATVTEEATGGVGSTVESVEAVPQAPPVPSAVPPAPPPAAPQVPVQAQTEPAPTPSPPPSRSSVDVPSVDGAASGVKDSAGSVASAAPETTQQPGGSEGSLASTPSNGSAASSGKSVTRAGGAAPSAPPSIVAAEVAPLHRWLARIWPAIALGGSVDRGWVAGVIVNLVRPAAAAAARLLSLVPSAMPAAGDSGLVGRRGTAKAPQPASSDAAPSVDGERILYLVAFAALLAVLALTVWKEFRAALPPGVH